MANIGHKLFYFFPSNIVLLLVLGFDCRRIRMPLQLQFYNHQQPDGLMRLIKTLFTSVITITIILNNNTFFCDYMPAALFIV